MNTQLEPAWEGALNHRDLGGLPASSRTVRHGVLARSAGLGSLTEAGRSALRETVSVVIDLRSQRETAAEPAPVHPATVRLPLLDGDAMAMDTVPTLTALYHNLLDTSGAAFARVARIVAGQTDGPALVHCTAGKDRTGLAVALLLDSVGVDRDAIVADYARSETQLGTDWADRMMSAVQDMGGPATPEIRFLVTRSPGPVMRDTLALIDSRYGGSARYLTAHGLDAQTLEGLAGRLLTDG